MKLIRNKSIKNKLILVTMLVVSITLSFAYITFLAYGIVKSENAMISELTGYARIIGNNSTAALTFNDTDSAKEILSSLEIAEDISYACILKTDGSIFAEYRNNNYSNLEVNPSKAIGYPARLQEGHIDISSRIILDGMVIGTIYIRSELNQLNAHIRKNIITGLILLVSSFILSYLLISRLQKIISNPIRYLAEISHEIASAKNYSIRAEKYKENRDEVGDLVRTFNEMLDQIEKRDASLIEAHAVLEKRVEERTQELQKMINELNQSRHAALSIMEDAEHARKEAEMERDKIEAMLRSIGDGVLVVDKLNRIILVNRAAEKIMGWRSDEITGKSADDIFVIVREDSDERVESPLVKVFAENRIVELSNHTALIRKDGTQVPIADSGAPILDKKGNLIGAVLVFRDISASRRIEKEKENLQVQLFQSQKMESIGILAGGIAHDFNNLLQGILGYVSMIKTRMHDNDVNLQNINLIELAAERAADLTQQLLSFARKGKYDIVSIKPEEIVKQVISLLARIFDRNIEISKNFGENILNIKGDRAQIHQAIMNICINAREAMPKGGKLSITVENVDFDSAEASKHPPLKPGKYVTFKIADTGVGMPDEIKSRIFEPFFTTKEPGKGTGLGLSMVFGVVQNHGGSVEVSSRIGEGSTFTLYFPASEVEVNKKSSSQSQMQDNLHGNTKSMSLSDNSDKTILIIDDEEIVNLVAQDMIKMAGYNTISARNGKEGVAIFSSRWSEIALVLLDMIMPELGGLETFRELKKINPNVKVIISSGYEEDERSQEIMKEGAFAYLRKPFLMQSLIDTINNAVNQNEEAVSNN